MSHVGIFNLSKYR